MRTLTDTPEWMELKRAVSILGLGGPFDVHNRAQKALANAEAALSGELPTAYTIGPGNTYHQAWLATLAGHQVRMPTWPPDQSWIFERTHQELLRVYGDTLGEWQLSGVVVCPTGAHQLSKDWIVLPIIDSESITV